MESCCCDDWADGRTANNHLIKSGDHFIAAPRNYKFGTLMIVPGYNNDQPTPVWDRGGAIKGNRIDLYFGSKDGVSGHKRALQWGRQYINVKVLKGQ
jgi:3D (Asp-Asp-Asp) domain-containing protein